MSDKPLSHKSLSPCVQICVIHAESGLCTGCYRTRAEIAGWSRMTNTERAALIDTLPARAPRLKQRRGGRAGRLARQQG